MVVIEISAMSPSQALLLTCLAFVSGVSRLGTVSLSQVYFSETFSRKRRRLAGGGEWTEWSSTEESWDESGQRPESSKDWGSDKDLEEEEEEGEESGEEAWRDVRELEDADILAVLSELINEELADEDERREEAKKTHKETQIDIVKAKKRRKGGRKRKKERSEEQIKRDRQREESRAREAEREELRKLEALRNREDEKKTERQIEKRQRDRDREKRQRSAGKESDEWQDSANEEGGNEEVSKRQSSLGPLRGGPRSSSRLKKVILQTLYILTF